MNEGCESPPSFPEKEPVLYGVPTQGILYSPFGCRPVCNGKGSSKQKTEPRLAGGLIDASGTMSGGGGKVASGGMRPAGKKVRRSSCDVL